VPQTLFDTRNGDFWVRPRERTSALACGRAGGGQLAETDLLRKALEVLRQPRMLGCLRQLHLSARAFHRTLKLARTIADLAGAETIAAVPAAEALQYRARKQV
jgi:predicted ATPase with chaperone activity